MIPSVASYPAWMNLLVNEAEFQNVAGVMTVLDGSGYGVEQVAEKILKTCDFTQSPGKFKVELIRVYPANFGFVEPPLVMDLYDRVVGERLLFLPTKWGPALRLGYKTADEPEGETTIMGMMPSLQFHDNYAFLTMYKQGGNSYLGSVRGNAIAKRFSLGDPIAFARSISKIA